MSVGRLGRPVTRPFRRLRALGLRARVAALLVAGLLFGAAAIGAVLFSQARRLLTREMTSEIAEMAERTAQEAAGPLALRDPLELAAIANRVGRDRFLVGVAITRPGGALAASRIVEPQLWVGPRSAPLPEPGQPAYPIWRRIHGTDVVIVDEPILRPAGNARPRQEAGDAQEPPVGPGGQILGWVRMESSTRRIEGAVAAAAEAGAAAVLVVLLASVTFLTLLLRVVVQPLKDASELAGEIAAGNLERRLPVSGGDELGRLAGSMNTMAAALSRSQTREREEAAALRETAEAVVSIARGARAAQDPGSAFREVGAGFERVTRCQGVALAVSSDHSGGPRFTHFRPASPWGGLEPGSPLDASLTAHLDGSDPPPLRLALQETEPGLVRGLARDGFRSALLVPLAVDDGPRAALLLASRDPGAFADSEIRVVVGLSSHLTAALRAAQLGDRLHRAFEDLQRTQEQLVRTEKLRATGELASGIAHEFNNVLAAILGRAQMLKRRAVEGRLGSADLLESLGVMELAARDGAETVRLLRQFSRGDDAGVEQPVDVDRVLRDALEFTRPSWKDAAEAGGRRIAVHLHSSPGLWIEGRASQLREAFTNLILNAVDALPHGGTIRLASSAAGRRVAVVVEDDGAGMSEETQQRIFDPFYTTKGARGTGLGLSVVYGTVQRHQGTIAVRSRPHEGTRFELTFPQLADGCAPALPAAERRPGACASTRVLVVDDESSVRDLLVEILEELGHEAVAFAEAEAALAEYRPCRFDLVITDLGMPGMSGWQFAAEIHRLDPGVRVALVTGWGDCLDPEDLRRVGAEVVLTKPFSIEDISGLLQDCAERRQPRAA